jgi:hypothetical protein
MPKPIFPLAKPIRGAVAQAKMTCRISRDKFRVTRTFFHQVDVASVIARLDRAISIPGRWLLDRPVKAGDDSAEVGQPRRKML